jgi:hypothetical protein
MQGWRRCPYVLIVNSRVQQLDRPFACLGALDGWGGFRRHGRDRKQFHRLPKRCQMQKIRGDQIDVHQLNRRGCHVIRLMLDLRWIKNHR